MLGGRQGSRSQPRGVWVFKNFSIRCSGKPCEVAGLASFALVRSSDQARRRQLLDLRLQDQLGGRLLNTLTAIGGLESDGRRDEELRQTSERFRREADRPGV